MAPITFEDIANIYELRLILEPSCAQIAATRATDDDISHMEGMLQVEEGRGPSEGISADLVGANFEFHMQLAGLTKNTRLISIVRNILEHVTRFDSMLPRYAPSTPWVRHRTIVEAITERDPMKAGMRMQEHVEQARLRILNVFAGHSPRLSLLPAQTSAALALPDPSGLRTSARKKKASRPGLARSEPRVLVAR